MALPRVILRAHPGDISVTTPRDVTAPGGKPQPLFVQDTAEMKSPSVRSQDSPSSKSPSPLQQKPQASSVLLPDDPGQKYTRPWQSCQVGIPTLESILEM